MKKLLFVITITSLLACTKYESIENFPIESPRLVANSLFTEGEPFLFRVSRSLSVLDNAQLNHVTDARVVLFRDQIAVDTIQGANEGDFYLSQIIPERGAEYHIQVSHAGYDPIISIREKLPAPIIIKDLQCVLIDSVASTNGWGRPDTVVTSYILDCTLTIVDQGFSDNIYALSVEKWDSIRDYYGPDLKWDRTGAYFLKSYDPALINNSGIGSHDILRDRLFFDNRSFAGSEYSFSFTLSDNMNWGTSLHREYNLIIHSFSHSSYMYARSRNMGGYVSSPFDEPNRVFTNMQGGYGIFAGVRFIEIPLLR